MGSYDNVGWNFVEEAVIRDRGYDEETVLTSILQSYFIKQGFVESLKALNEELKEMQTMAQAKTITQTPAATQTPTRAKAKAAGLHGGRRRGKDNHVKQNDFQNGNVLYGNDDDDDDNNNNNNNANNVNHNSNGNFGRNSSNGKGKASGKKVMLNENNAHCDGDNNDTNAVCGGGGGSDGSIEKVLEAMKKRKHLQLLCLNEKYEEAAALLPPGNIFIVKLLAMEAMKRAKLNVSDALLFLCEKVGPLMADLSDATLTHQIYIKTLAVITGAEAPKWMTSSPCVIAREVNESLLDDHDPSALHVLLSWSEWQGRINTQASEEEGGKQSRGGLSYKVETEKI